VVLPQVPSVGLAPPAVGTGAISGVVTDGQTGRPIAGALVQLDDGAARLSAPPSRPRQMTDGSGHFIFQHVAAGSYKTRVTAPGYLDGGYGRVPGSQAAGQVTLQDKQWFADANAVLWKPASISGTIRDERGEPLVDIPVRLVMAFGLAGREQWAFGAVTQTDDRGAYRFAGLLPGRYVVFVPNIQITLADGQVALWRWTKVDPLPVVRAADGLGTMAASFAVPPPGHGQVYAATFCPAARSLSTADVVALDVGSDRRAVDVSLVPVSSVRVSGSVVGPADAVADLPVRLMAAGNESLGFGFEAALTRTDMAGKFTLADVPEGNYTVIVQRVINAFHLDRPDPTLMVQTVVPRSANPFDGYGGVGVGGEPSVFLNALGSPKRGADVTGRTSISVGTEAIEGLVVPTTAGVTISGRAFFDGADAPAPGRAIVPFGPMITVDPADGDITRTVRSSLTGFVPKVRDASGAQPGPADPTFSIPNVMPGRYRLIGDFNRDYHFVGATWNGQDLFAKPLDVTGEGPVTGIVVYLSSKKNSVSGVVRAADGKPSAGAVLIFPQDPDRWRETGISAVQFRTLDVSLTGGFSTENLIPGDYFIAAVPIEDRKRGLDIDFLTTLTAQATRITLSETATLTIDLRIIGAPR
jgi:hypothetical protein